MTGRQSELVAGGHLNQMETVVPSKTILPPLTSAPFNAYSFSWHTRTRLEPVPAT
jgi:hypothetical protein